MNEREAYRQAAQRITGFKVDPHHSPHIMADGSGAFVEVHVWVSKEAAFPVMKPLSEARVRAARKVVNAILEKADKKKKKAKKR